ncbi:MAG: hypothetical protein M3Q76_12495 [Acidobacteriota bacterium]|nr:hypothetical protein [Acidobacteriota bacterium]
MSEAAERAEMRSLPLEGIHRRLGASFVERDGWLAPAHYGDPVAEYEVVRGSGGAGLFDLSARGRIAVSGAETVQFLNGLITNDVKALQPGASMTAAFPNVQGRLLAHVRVLRPGQESDLILDSEPISRERVFAALERFTLAGDFRVSDLTAETAQLSVQGARAAAVVGAALGPQIARIGRGSVVAVQPSIGGLVTAVRATHTAEDGFDLACQAADAAALWEALVAAGARPCGHETLEVLRIEAGVPRYGVDVDETNVVLEAGTEDEAVSYTKGCYVGQEIIARIHWRGHVAKRLAGLSLAVAEMELPAVGAEVKTADGKKIGRVTSATHSPTLGHGIALAMLKYDFLPPGTEVVVASAKNDSPAPDESELAARVVELPFVRGSWYAAAPDGGAGDQ